MGTKEDFLTEFEKLKFETHKKFDGLFEKFCNTKRWKIDFTYEWCVENHSSIDKDDAGWNGKNNG